MGVRLCTGIGSVEGSSDGFVLPKGPVLCGMDLASQEHMVSPCVGVGLVEPFSRACFLFTRPSESALRASDN